jgi:Trk-type K+ transport system membrane component
MRFDAAARSCGPALPGKPAAYALFHPDYGRGGVLPLPLPSEQNRIFCAGRPCRRRDHLAFHQPFRGAAVLLFGYFPSVVDCLFESISGFTTTGASILATVEELPKSILFWRSFTHWIGGMGVLILTLALLPSLGARAHYLMDAESPGPQSSKLVPKVGQSSKILYAIYVALTALEAIALLIAGLPLYDAAVTTFATAGTGGFSVRNLSIASYGNPTAEIIISIFMILFGINFTVFFLFISGKIRSALRSEELRLYLSIIAVSVFLMTLNVNPFTAARGSPAPFLLSGHLHYFNHRVCDSGF